MIEQAPEKENWLDLALEAALTVATAHGLSVSDPQVLRNRGNVVIHLKPYPVVARLATLTGQVRADGGGGWLEREIAVLSYLTQVNAPSVQVSPLIPPGPYTFRGLALSFVEWVNHDPTRSLSPYELGQKLKNLHQSLADCPLKLPLLTPVVELEHWLWQAQQIYSFAPTDRELLEKSYKRIAQNLLKVARPGQIIHGDAHAGNLLHTERGAIWNDFEETCYGPVEWDLACLLNKELAFGSGENVAAVLAGYGADFSVAELMPFVEARMLEAILWMALLSQTYPDITLSLENYLAWLRARF